MGKLSHGRKSLIPGSRWDSTELGQGTGLSPSWEGGWQGTGEVDRTNRAEQPWGISSAHTQTNARAEDSRTRS